MQSDTDPTTVDALSNDDSLLEVNDCLEAFHTATTPIRFRILYHLHVNGNATVEELTETLQFTEPEITSNAKLLINAGHIRHWEDGTDNDPDAAYYELTNTGEDTIATLTTHIEYHLTNSE
jgi:DNA-binding MarR family transcriptional regulator